LLLLSVVSFSIYLSLEFAYQAIPEIQPWLLSFTTATFGSYLTAIVVDKSFRDKERREQERIRTTALRRLEAPLNAHLSLLAGWYVTASAKETLNEPDSFRSLLEDDFTETVTHFDFLAEAPATAPNQDWLDYSAHELQNFNQEIERVLAKHGAYLDSETIEILEQLADSTVSSIVISRAKTRPEIQRWRTERGIDSTEVGEHLALVINEQVEEHVENVLRLMQHYEERGLKFKSTGTSPLSDSIAPSVESARLDISIEG
jgi:hypothetical protein